MKYLFFICLILFGLSVNSVFGEKYFQQHVSYTINVKLNDKTHELSAFETVVYKNNSPDALQFLYFHLWPNAYKNNKTALAKQLLEERWSKLFKQPELQGYIDSLDFEVNHQKVNWEYADQNIDICKITLDKPLQPGDSIVITTPFHVKIPKGVTSRLGHIGQSYQMTQWYPKPAVYDRYGWHPIPYLNQGEFYSEFGSFDVSITLPKNYIVGATGDLQNKDEYKWLCDLATKTAAIDTFDLKDNSFPKSSNELKTIRYKQNKVHDFAWFADKRFNVLKGEQILPASGRKVTTWLMFLNSQANLWKNALEYIDDALLYYSRYMGDYPYNNCTAVHSALTAGAGMEYPNITVIGNSGTARELEIVIMHEVGHNWLYGVLGFNERDYAWMDEGLNSFCESRYMQDKYGENDGISKMLGKDKLAHFFEFDKIRYKQFDELSYLFSARQNSDQPASLTASLYTSNNYGNIIYKKVSDIFNYLMDYLGEDKFNEIFRSFYEEWKFKHPYPEDLRKAFEQGTGEDLSWIFDDLLQTTKKEDYKIVSANESGFTIKNKGMIPGPLKVVAFKGSDTLLNVWYPGFNGKKSFEADLSQANKVVIDPDWDMTEFFRSNNTERTHGIFKKVEPLSFRFAGVVENSEKTRINFIPAMGWNNYDKYMLGAAFYSALVPRSKFEYQVVPMFAFGANDLAGSAVFAYNIMPYNAGIKNIKLKLSAMQYAYEPKQGSNFQRYKLTADFLFRNKVERDKIYNHLYLNTVAASNIEDILNNKLPGLNTFYSIIYSYKNYRTFYPYTVKAGAQLNKNFVKTEVEGTYKIIYTKAKSVDFRLYGGTFLYKTKDLSPLYYINLSGTSGIDDYTYNSLFFGRFENPVNGTFLSNQFVPDQGGFTTYTPFGRTDEWLLSLNISSSIPFIPKALPFKIYANFATFGNTQPVPGYSTLPNYAWEGGVKFIVANGFEVYLPLITSVDLQDITNDMFPKYTERIRFTINLNTFNPSQLINF